MSPNNPKQVTSEVTDQDMFKPLNAELNLIRHLLALVGARHIVHVSRIRVNSIQPLITTKNNSVSHSVTEVSNCLGPSW